MTDPPSLPPPPFWRTVYFANSVRPRPDRSAISDADILSVLGKPMRREEQADGRWRLWGRNRIGTHWLRVVLLPDGKSVHTAHLDRNFRP